MTTNARIDGDASQEDHLRRMTVLDDTIVKSIGAYARRRLWRSPADVREEVLQEIYLSLAENEDSYNPQKATTAVWARMIARARIADHLRNVYKEKDRIEVLLDTLEFPDPDLAPGEIVADTDLKLRLRRRFFTRSLRHLTEQHQMLIQARFVKQLVKDDYVFVFIPYKALSAVYGTKRLVSLHKVAEYMNTTEDHVKKNIKPAHGALREAWRASGTCQGEERECVCMSRDLRWSVPDAIEAVLACMER